MPVTDATVFKIYDTSAAEWKRITALQLKNDIADPLDWLIVYDGTTDNQWEKIDPTGFKALTAATDYAITLDTGEKVPGTLLEAYFGGGFPDNTWSMDIDTADTSWTLRTGSACTVNVDWGDGNSEQLVLSGVSATTHNYAAPGQYVVTFTLVSGVLGPYYASAAENDITALNGTGLGWDFGNTLEQAFYGQHSLTSIDAAMDTSEITTFRFAFRDAGIVEFALDTSSATDLYGACMFCSDLSVFLPSDASKVTRISRALWGSSIASFPSLALGACNDFSYMCYDCTSLVVFPLLDMSAGNDFTGTWTNCSLDAASIENITQALIANGRSNLTTTINGVVYSSWTAQAQSDYIELTTNRGWTITTS